MRRPSEAHVRAAKKVLRYLSGCKAATRIYHQGDHNGLVKLALFADADFAGEVPPNSGAKASTSCIVLFAKGVGLLHFVSKLQPTIARSTMEAEYRAAALGGIWIEIGRNFFGELNLLVPDPVALYEDNSACLTVMDSPLMKGYQYPPY